MPRIPEETVQRVLDAVDIVDVVGDYVSLKRRGANYMGLCPFHNERTPSFAVSRSKGIYKCFSCGKGGSALNFVMEMEQISFQEAIRQLGRKYGIEIEEREQTPEEVAAARRREGLFAANELAAAYFADTLVNTADGRDIGLSYFRSRGINDDMIARFRLGYSLERPADAFYRHATAKGYRPAVLDELGLCKEGDHGEWRDRFRGRVMFPVFTVSGKVVAFGGRVLQSGKVAAKYINSPESAVYNKSAELYGLYQAKQAISKADKCLLVEGYLDVISMHQSGICNVVASSGTSLTERQAALIHRFTRRVTLVYDADPAGIKASLRGIDLLLAEGLEIKVLLLPDGHDPDSFAQSRGATEVEAYINEHEEDFISFKIHVLMAGHENDPLTRANVATDITRTIAVIPDEITRRVYVQQTAATLGLPEDVLARRVNVERNERTIRDRQQQQREAAREAAKPQPEAPPADQPSAPALDPAAAQLRIYELQLLAYAVRYGAYEVWTDEQDGSPLNVVGYICSDLEYEGLALANADVQQLLDECRRLVEGPWLQGARDQAIAAAQTVADEARRQGVEEIRRTLTGMTAIEHAEAALEEEVEERRRKAWLEECSHFMTRRLMNSADDTVRNLATRLGIERHTLSKIHSKTAHVETDADRLDVLVPRALNEYKGAIVEMRRREQCTRLQKLVASGAPEQEISALMQQMQENLQLKRDFAKYCGDRIIIPRRP